MKPTKILDVMDLALEARKQGSRFAPCFRGAAGLGKSEIVQQWVAKQREKDPNFGFIDLRIAYLEAPDFLGVPVEREEDGRIRTSHALPDWWPTSGAGIILAEEFNRGTTGVLNCLMQLMTDRKIGPHYTLPEGWVIAAAINPDDPAYDLNTIDAALADRFEFFDIDYDRLAFLSFMESTNYDPNIIMYVKAGEWIYKEPGAIATKEGGKYISPRTWSKMNAAEKAGAKDKGKQFHHMICTSILGKHVGNAYYKACWDDAPVTAQDLIDKTEASLAKLKEQSNPKSYQGDRVAVTVESIISNYGGLSDEKGGACKADQIDEDLMAKVALVIPADQAINLIRECGFKAHRSSINTFLKEFTDRHPECVDMLRSNIKINKTTEVKKTK